MADRFDDVYVDTRRQLRAVAESLLAGPQQGAAGTIRLSVRPDGFTGVAIPIAVHGTELVWPNAAPLTGPINALADAAGVDAGPADGGYDIGDALPTDAVLGIDAGAADLIAATTRAGTRSTTSCPTGIPCCGPSTSTSRPPRTK